MQPGISWFLQVIWYRFLLESVRERLLVEFWRGNILQNAVREIGKEIVPGSSCISIIGDIWGSEPLVSSVTVLNTLRTGDVDLRFYVTTVEDGWRKSAFLTRACFPCTIHLIMQYIEPVSEWSCWRMFIETWPHSELTFRQHASST